jgi:polyhydroxybutyrate depolymerase
MIRVRGRRSAGAPAALIAAMVMLGAGCSSTSTGAASATAASTAATSNSSASDAARSTTSVAHPSPAAEPSVTTLPVLPSVGCSRPASPAVTNERVDLSVNGAPRWYLLTTPAPGAPVVPASASVTASSPGAPIPRPLVLDFHGLDEGAVLHSETTQFGALGQKDGFVVAFPNGSGTPVQWDTTSHSPTNADLVFVKTLLAQIEASQCIDTSRVYASGFSDGSFMASLLACTMSDTFAAIGAVSGLQLDPPCHTTRPVPVITFHGTADPILYFNGGIGTATLKRLIGLSGSAGSSTTSTTQPLQLDGPGVPATVKAWAVKDGCRTSFTDTTVAPKVILRTYPCPKGTAVEFYIILGGGHSWPGSQYSQSISSITGTTTFAINATDLIWAFFQRFQL